MNTFQMGIFQSVTCCCCVAIPRLLSTEQTVSFSERLCAAREEAAEEGEEEAQKRSLSEEELSRLRALYPDEMDTVTVVRAVRMIYAMGGMSRVEYCTVWGARLDSGAGDVPAFPELFSLEELRSARFARAPIIGFQSLEDILNWLDELRGNDPEWELIRMGLENV